MDNRNRNQDLISEATEIPVDEGTTQEQTQETPDQHFDEVPEETEAEAVNEAELDAAEKEEAAPDEEAKAEADYKDRYTKQTQENLIQEAKNKKLTETIKEAAQFAEPTEAELKAEYEDWEMLTPTEKKLAKQSYVANKRFESVYKAVEEGTRIDEWIQSVDSFLAKPEAMQSFPQLEGREDEFRKFALKPSRRGVDMEDIVRSFSFDLKPTVRQKRGALLATQGGGEKPATQAMNEEDSATLRTKDSRLWRQAIKGNKIKIEI